MCYIDDLCIQEVGCSNRPGICPDGTICDENADCILPPGTFYVVMVYSYNLPSSSKKYGPYQIEPFECYAKKIFCQSLSIFEPIHFEAFKVWM